MNTDRIMELIVGVLLVFTLVGATWGASVTNIDNIDNSTTGATIIKVLPYIVAATLILLIYRTASKKK